MRTKMMGAALAFGIAFGGSGLAQAADFTMKLGLSSAEDSEHNFTRMIKIRVHLCSL